MNFWSKDRVIRPHVLLLQLVIWELIRGDDTFFVIWETLKRQKKNLSYLNQAKEKCCISDIRTHSSTNLERDVHHGHETHAVFFFFSVTWNGTYVRVFGSQSQALRAHFQGPMNLKEARNPNNSHWMLIIRDWNFSLMKVFCVHSVGRFREKREHGKYSVPVILQGSH